jgi:uncharacterized protein (DUF433 family)
MESNSSQLPQARIFSVSGFLNIATIKSMEANFWKDCPYTEVIPGKVSGQPLLKGTRVQADTIVESAELGETPEEIAANYRLKLSDVKALLAYAASHSEPAPVR